MSNTKAVVMALLLAYRARKYRPTSTQDPSSKSWSLAQIVMEELLLEARSVVGPASVCRDSAPPRSFSHDVHPAPATDILTSDDGRGHPCRRSQP